MKRILERPLLFSGRRARAVRIAGATGILLAAGALMAMGGSPNE